VWKAASSLRFLSKAKHLHMVDPWRLSVYDKEDTGWVGRTYQGVLDHNTPMIGSNDPVAVQEYYEEVYAEVCEKVKEYPATVYRETSDEWFKRDIKLDWIYIDGDHSYDGCYRDLTNALNVTNDTIFCDDYNVPHHEGVRFAINDFCSDNKLTPIPLCKNQCMIKLC